MDNTMRRRVLDDRKIYRKAIANSGLAMTSQTWRLIDWARLLPVDSWKFIVAGVDDEGIEHYLRSDEALRLHFENAQNEVFANCGENDWMVRRWEPTPDEWRIVVIALRELEANQRLAGE